MDFSGFVSKFFIEPIWQRSGYNPINTTAYILIALAAAYAIFILFKRLGVKIDRNLVTAVVPFILLGATARVVTDSIDTGVAQSHRGALFGLFGAVIDSGLYNYGYLTVTPGIYVVVGLFTLACVLLFHHFRRVELLPYFGALLWLSQLVLIASMAQNYLFFFIILSLAALGVLVSHPVLSHARVKLPLAWLAVFSHALDGAATFVILDVYNPLTGASYFEQHIVSRAIGELFGSMLAFYIVKVAFATGAVILLDREKDAQEKMYILLLLVIFGLAPGTRDALRLLAGA